METEKELNAKIIKLLKQIQENHPGLAKLLGEMPLTIPNEPDPQVNTKALKAYYESLQMMLKARP